MGNQVKAALALRVDGKAPGFVADPEVALLDVDEVVGFSYVLGDHGDSVTFDEVPGVGDVPVVRTVFLRSDRDVSVMLNDGEAVLVKAGGFVFLHGVEMSAVASRVAVNNDSGVAARISGFVGG